MSDGIGRRALLGAAAAGTAFATADRAFAQIPALAVDPSRRLDARDFGATGDGTRHVLRDRFASLDAARGRYPSARSLDDTLDSAAIQGALDLAGERRTAVHLPRGNYILSRSLELPSFAALVGEGAVIDHQNVPLAAPLIVAKDRTTLIYAAIANVVLRGGTHAVKIDVTGETAGLVFDGVTMELQTVANFACSRLLQTAHFRRCTFDGAPVGLEAGWTTNAVDFFDCAFTNHARAHLLLRSGEVVNIFGGRFEGGGRAGADATIDVEDVRNLNFNGTYFEGTHPLLLRERRSAGTTRFEGCHFTGGKPGTPFAPYRFDSDGLVTFGTNSWTVGSPGPRRMLVTGHNDGSLTRGDAAVYSAIGPHLAFCVPSIPVAADWTAIAEIRRRPEGAGIPRLLADLEFALATPSAVPVSARARLTVDTAGGRLVARVGESEGVSTRMRQTSDDLAMLEVLAPQAATLGWSLRSVAGASGNGRILVLPITP